MGEENSVKKNRDKEKEERTDNQKTDDPGRTPLSAEGDEQVIDEDIRIKEEQGKL